MTKNYKVTGGTGCIVAALAILLVIALWLGVVALGGFIIMLAWNLVFPALFGWPELTFPMAFGLSLFLGIVGSLFRR